MKNWSFPQACAFSICCLFLFLSFNSFAQVGIGNTNPNNDALLEIGDATTTTKGLLLPRVNLVNTSSFAPMTAHVQGMVVYNKNTAGDVTPGYYYNNGSQWVRLAADAPSDDWSRAGNAGTVANTNFLGTTDDMALRFRTYNSDKFEISSGNAANRGRLRAFENGSAARPTYSWQTDTDLGMYRISANTLGFSASQASFNGNPLYAFDRFTVHGADNEYAINAYASGANGVGVFAESIGYDGMVAIAARYGVYGSGSFGTYGDGVLYGSYGIVDNSTGMGMRAHNSNSSGTGLLASGNNALGNYLGGGSGVAGSGNTGMYGRSLTATGTGVIASGNNNASIAVSPNGSGLAGSGSVLGIFGYAGLGSIANGNRGNHGGEFILDSDNDPTTNTATNGNRATAILAGFDDIAASGPGGVPNLPVADSYFGGYFSGGNENASGTPPSYSYVGLRYNTGSNGTTGTDYKIIGPGTVSTLINDHNNNPRIMFAPESPEIVFQDYGVGKLTNGVARIRIDPILRHSLYIDDQHPLKVYVTLEGDCKGVYVTDKSSDGFTVKELQGGTSNVSFSWQIVANRADSKDANGNIISKHVGLRLPEGPGPLKVEAIQLETKDVKPVIRSNIKRKNAAPFTADLSEEKE
ncbi:hypothetical protein [Aequorivita vladivostokensis]|uniref:hypothetical protein n=1 Tax=Aequorivita vladivostokensis TaxID=171194 RepID=UPI0006988D38|nr:hypothetical protein [Aequorivita vladivostokensis]